MPVRPISSYSHVDFVSAVQGMDVLASAAANSKQQRRAVLPIQDMDMCFTELAAALPVDVMPVRDCKSSNP